MNRLLLTLSSLLLFFIPVTKFLCTAHTRETYDNFSRSPSLFIFRAQYGRIFMLCLLDAGKTCFSTLIGRIILKHRSAGKKTLQSSLPAGTWCENEKREFCLRSTRLAWKNQRMVEDPSPPSPSFFTLQLASLYTYRTLARWKGERLEYCPTPSCRCN